MKKIFALALLSLFFIISCKQEYGILDYQDNNIEAECEINQKYKVVIIKNGGTLSLEIREPLSLCGVKFQIADGKASIIKNELKIPISKESLRGICALTNIFSLDEGTITTATENNIISFENEYGIYRVLYGESSLPQKIEISGDGYDYAVTINTIKLTKTTD